MNTKFLTKHDAIIEWLNQYCYIYYDHQEKLRIRDTLSAISISPTGAVTIDGNIEFKPFAQDKLTGFKVRFDHISGSFTCSKCIKLKSLEGSPRTIGGSFNCSGCTALASLQGAPTIVNNFHCYACQALTNLVGSPEQVSGDFDCSHCKRLVSFEGAPLFIGGGFKSEQGHARVTLAGLNTVNGRIVLPRMDRYDATTIRKLIQQKAKIVVRPSASSVLIRSIQRYHRSGDLLTAIAQFEAYFQEPFYDTMIPASLTDIPSL